MKVDGTSKHIVGIIGIVALVAVFILVFGDADSIVVGQATGAFCGDGICARPEARRGTCAADCPATDSDGDGLYDYQETLGIYGSVSFSPTNPHDNDSDDDGYTDSEEVITYGTNPNDALSYPRSSLPDLAYDTSGTSVALTGTVYMYDGVVYDETAEVNVGLGIINLGEDTASGNIRSFVSLYSDFSSITTSLITSTGFSLSPSSTTTVSGTGYVYSSSLTYLQALYGSSSSSPSPIQLNYAIDSYSYSRSGRPTYGISESNEINNNGTVYIVPDISGLVFEEVECRDDRDCPVTCGCGEYRCVEMIIETSGASTYRTYTNTTCSS